MQSKASPKGSVGSPVWQPATFPGLPCSGNCGQQPALPVVVEVTVRQVAGQAPPTSVHCPVVSSVACTADEGPVIGSGLSVKTA